MRKVSRKRATINRQAETARKRFKEELKFCCLCGWAMPAIDVHEIVGGGARVKAIQTRAAWLLVCRLCHDQVQYMPRVRQLVLKAKSDPVHYDRQAVNILAGRQADAITEAEVIQDAIRFGANGG